jgi:NitT/TauT family transport system ATP-binding protein
MSVVALAEATVPPAPSLVTLENVSKTYRSKRGNVSALEDVNLQIGDTEFLSVLGPSGCGKSTLLRCLAGLDYPTSGEIRVGGELVKGPPKDLGVVLQRDVLLEWRSVLQNVLLPVEARGLRVADWREKARQHLDLLGLLKFENRYPFELSGGMRQRVSICRALLMNPNLLLMDEPFGALDAMTRDELNLELQKVWMEDSKTVFFVTHSIPEAVFLGDRVIVMSPSPGRILKIIEVDLPRPRDLSVRETPQFGTYAREIRGIFQEMGLLRAR